MKTLPILFILSMVITSCMQNAKSEKPSTSNNNQIANSNNDTSFAVVIRDSSDYSNSFIKSLKPQNSYWKFCLDSNLLILNNVDTIKFPDIIQLNQSKEFSGKKGDLIINLTIKRIAQTTIDYKFSMTLKKETPIIKSGIADLSPNFFLGSEIDEIYPSGKSYSSTEYWDINDNFFTSIRIGKNPDNQKTLVAKIKCTLGSISINLDNCPSLMEINHGSL